MWRKDREELLISATDICLLSAMNRALCQVVNIKLSKIYGLPLQELMVSGRTEGWGDEKFTTGCERGKLWDNRSTCKGHFLQTELRMEDLTRVKS